MDLAVTAFNPWSEDSRVSNVLTVTPGATNPPPVVTVPAAPTNLGLQLVDPHRIDLVWTSDRTAITEIERSKNGAGFIRVATTAAGVQHWSDLNAWKKDRLAYRLKSVNSAGASPWSVVTYTP